jgi:uncharacterized protein (TIGR02466 family)
LSAGRETEAAALAERALAAAPGLPAALSVRGVLQARRGLVADALADLEAAAKGEPSNPAHDFNLGCLLYAQRRLADAAACFEAACQKGPDFAAAWMNLGLLYLDTDRLADAEARFRRAAELTPGQAAVWSALGIALQRQGRTDAALDAFRRARAIEPSDARHVANMASLLFESGRYAEAEEHYRDALRLLPDNPDLNLNLGITLFRAGNLKASEAAIERCLARAPGHTRGLAMRAALLAETGRGAELRDLVNFDRFLRASTLRPPPGFPTLEAFNAALAEQVRNHASLMNARPSKATRNGSQTSELFGPAASGALAALEREVAKAVGAYVEQLGSDSGHPFIAARPQRYRLTAWGTLLRDGGHQHPHNHPSAWLSGVYYVTLPQTLGGDDDRRGWIEFGEPDPDFIRTAKPETRPIRPQTGLLLLFPSYLWHRTVPFSGNEERISIAFDVLRAP